MARSGAHTRERILDAAQVLVLDQGLAATSIDQVLTASGTTKGAFFHHFPTKNDLARAIVERYAAADIAFLEEFMTRAEAASDDPAVQLVAFVRFFEDMADELVAAQPSCLYVSYAYERQLFENGTNDVIADALLAYRSRLAAKVEAAAAVHPPRLAIEPGAVADHLNVTFEGAFLLTRALGDSSLMKTQLGLVRRYVADLFGVAPD